MIQTTIDGLFQEQKTEWLEEARRTAHDLLKHRESITINDVLRQVPLPSFLHKNTIGSVFNKEFRLVGYVKSNKPSARGRAIGIWTNRWD